ncbi:hypothetical protein AB5N19_01558 [Seiridium cardinale]
METVSLWTGVRSIVSCRSCAVAALSAVTLHSSVAGVCYKHGGDLTSGIVSAVDAKVQKAVNNKIEILIKALEQKSSLTVATTISSTLTHRPSQPRILYASAKESVINREDDEDTSSDFDPAPIRKGSRRKETVGLCIENTPLTTRKNAQLPSRRLNGRRHL